MTRPAITEVRGGVTAPRGFLATGLHVGIKKSPLLDLALLVSTQEGPIAGLFTSNRVAAAPVLLDRVHLRRGRGRALIINSGNANACTGAQGLRHAKEMARLVAVRVGTPLHTVFVGSTGVIGRSLPITKIRRGMPALFQRLSPSGASQAANAILTTDTRSKQIAVRGNIAGHVFAIGGMAKGAGMIHPDMATMLAYLTTDVSITRSALERALRAAVDNSFHGITVDGDTSTNDMVLCLSNGLAGNPVVREGSSELTLFQHLLSHACDSLATQICRDGEGITKVVRVVVTGARTVAEARRIARTVGTSCLVKTAFFGEDANWGRVLAAIGRAGVPVDQNRISLAFDGRPIVRRGVGLGPRAERAVAPVMRRKEFSMTVGLEMGKATAQLLTTDLSYDYVKINASYRT